MIIILFIALLVYVILEYADIHSTADYYGSSFSNLLGGANNEYGIFSNLLGGANNEYGIFGVHVSKDTDDIKFDLDAYFTENSITPKYNDRSASQCIHIFTISPKFLNMIYKESKSDYDDIVLDYVKLMKTKLVKNTKHIIMFHNEVFNENSVIYCYDFITSYILPTNIAFYNYCIANKIESVLHIYKSVTNSYQLISYLKEYYYFNPTNEDKIKIDSIKAGNKINLLDYTSKFTLTWMSRHSPQHDWFMCGLMNLGNTCFLNSAIQAFRCVPHFYNFIKTYDYTSVQSPYVDLSVYKAFFELNKLYQDMEGSSCHSRVCNPIDFRNSLGNIKTDISQLYTSYEQDDAGIPLNVLIYICNINDRSINNNTRLLMELVKIKYPFTNINTTYNSFRCLSNLIFRSEMKCPHKINTSYTEKSLQDINYLDLDPSSIENLDRTCDHCDIIESTDDYVYIPSVLIFSSDVNEDSALYPDELKLDSYKRIIKDTFEDNTYYTFYKCAQIIHEGETAKSGHYYTYGKSLHTEKWILFNDSSVSYKNPPEKTKTADTGHIRMVIYYRKDF